MSIHNQDNFVISSFSTNIKTLMCVITQEHEIYNNKLTKYSDLLNQFILNS